MWTFTISGAPMSPRSDQLLICHPLQLNFIIITGVSLGWFSFNIVFHQCFPSHCHANFCKLSKKLAYKHGRLQITQSQLKMLVDFRRLTLLLFIQTQSITSILYVLLSVTKKQYWNIQNFINLLLHKCGLL